MYVLLQGLLFPSSILPKRLWASRRSRPERKGGGAWKAWNKQQPFPFLQRLQTGPERLCALIGREFLATKGRWVQRSGLLLSPPLLLLLLRLVFDVSFHALCMSVHSPVWAARNRTYWALNGTSALERMICKHPTPLAPDERIWSFFLSLMPLGMGKFFPHPETGHG